MDHTFSTDLTLVVLAAERMCGTLFISPSTLFQLLMWSVVVTGLCYVSPLKRSTSRKESGVIMFYLFQRSASEHLSESKFIDLIK